MCLFLTSSSLPAGLSCGHLSGRHACGCAGLAMAGGDDFSAVALLGLAKRRDDLLIRDASQTAVRKVIKYYNHDFLNACITMVSGIIMVPI